MNINQAWQTVLEQIQTEMPRASFDTWVRDTRPLSYDDGRLTIGVRTSYARDWLESRLTSTVSRLLIGIMNRTVDVVFVVDVQDDSLDEDDGDSGEEKTFSGQRAPVGGVSLHERYATLYQQEVKPNKVVTYPAYLVRHVVQGDMDASDALMGIAFAQSVYRIASKTGTNRIRQNIPHDDVLKWAVISRASFWRKLSGDQTELCGGLVQKLPEVPDYSRSNRRLDNANFYQINLIPHFTRRDSSVLEHVMALDVAEADNDSDRVAVAEKTLRRLLGMASYAWLDEIDIALSPSPAKGMVEIVRCVVGVEGNMPAGLHQLAEELQDRIIRKFGKLVIPHHFLLVTSPAKKLSAAQAWAVIVLRYLRYYDNDTREWMDFILAHQGLDGLLRKLSVKPRAFKRWVEESNFGLFVTRAKIKVEGEDNEQQSIRKWIDRGGEVYWVLEEEPPLWYEEVDGEMLPHWTWGETKMRLDAYQNETHPLPKRDSVITKMRLTPYQNETRLNNILIKLLLNYPNIPTTTPRQNEERPVDNSPAARGGGGWDISALLKLNPVIDKKLKKYIEAAGDPTAFVSWLLYAHGPESKGITAPSALAISNLGSDLQQGARQVYLRLARLGPQELRKQLLQEIQRASNPYSFGSQETAFHAVMKGVGLEKLNSLAGCLFEDVE